MEGPVAGEPKRLVFRIKDSIQINDYVFNYPSIFSLAPLDYQYTITLPLIINNDYYLTFKPFQNIRYNFLQSN
jgi:hypothetical protein